MTKIDVNICNKPHSEIRNDDEWVRLGTKTFPNSNAPTLYLEHEGKTIQIRLIES